MKTLNWETFVSNVQGWAKERGIYEHSTPEAQLLKGLSELGELADGIIKNDQDALKDAIGDIAVCMVNYAGMSQQTLNFTAGWTHGRFKPALFTGFLCYQFSELLNEEYKTKGHETAIMISTLLGLAATIGLDFMECCTAAWEEIKDRKGKMVVGGAFIKEA